LAEIFQWKGEVAEGLPGYFHRNDLMFKDFSAEEKEHVEQELSDVFIYLMRLAEKCHVDLPAAVVRKVIHLEAL
jgi:dCTP diphosphatase